MALFIINSRGEKELFSLQKVERSARNSGVSSRAAREIAKKIQAQAYNGISTEEIFQKVKQFLSGQHPAFGIRFNLKQAMKSLGPAGFNFEKYAGAILGRMGYGVKINQFVSGKCLKKYEIDFLAEKDKVLRIGECKYHHQSGLTVDQEVALANYARFLDIQNSSSAQQRKNNGWQIKSILMTNARFSDRAIKYSQCVGVELWGWKYPVNKGLEVFIDQNKLYPITILPSFQKQWADIFNQRNIILAGDVPRLNLERISRESGIGLGVFNKMAAEAKMLLETK